MVAGITTRQHSGLTSAALPNTTRPNAGLNRSLAGAGFHAHAPLRPAPLDLGTGCRFGRLHDRGRWAPQKRRLIRCSFPVRPPFYLFWKPVKRLPGPRASRPHMSAKRENETETYFRKEGSSAARLRRDACGPGNALERI